MVKSKIVSFVLILSMLMVLISSIPVFAYEILNGTCSENVTWSLDSNGTLTIKGTGEIENACFIGTQTCRKTVRIIIEPGVTSIDRYAFGVFDALTEVTIPNTVTTIKERAFNECIKLANISIPASVTNIEDGVFDGCTNLENIEVDENNQFYCSLDGNLFSKDKTILKRYVPSKTDTAYIVPEGVKTISKGAFSVAPNLTSITLPVSLESIYFGPLGSYIALDNLMNIYYEGTLKEWNKVNTDDIFIKLGEKVRIHTKDALIDSSVFETGNCGENASYILANDGTLTIKGTGEIKTWNGDDWDNYSGTIVYNNGTFTMIDDGVKVKKVVIEPGITSVDAYIFSNETELTSITIPDTVTVIEREAFFECKNLKNIIIPNSVTKIEGSAFEGCESLENIVIPSNVTDIEHEAFANCTNLANIDVDKNNKNYASIDGNLFSKDGTHLLQYAIGKQEKEYKVPYGVSRISYYAFKGCMNLEKVVVPSGVTEIGSNAFESCENLKSVSIPDSLTSIESPFPYNNGIAAFDFCPNLESINVDENNQKYCSINGSLFTKDKTTLLKCAVSKNVSQYIVPDHVTCIGDDAFVSCKNLTNIIIPETVTKIGLNTFLRCTNLTDIIIPSSVTEMHGGTFRECENLRSITLSNSLTRVGGDAFWGCVNLTSLAIPDGVTSVGEDAFTLCENLTTLVIPDSVEEIGRFSFDADCYSATIYGTPGSYAEAYALMNEIPFERLIEVTYGGNKIKFDQPPIAKGGRTLVPVRAIFEALGATVEWDGATSTVTSTLGDTTINLVLGNNVMKVNDKELTLDVPAEALNGRTLVPVRAISEAFGCKVNWNANTYTVVIE